MDEFKNNSLKAKAEEAKSADSSRKITPITTSTVRSKGKLQKVVDSFLHRNKESITDYVIETVLIPSLTNSISGIGDIIIDSLIEGVGVLFSNSGFDIHRERKTGTTTSYSEYYRKRHRGRASEEYDDYGGDRRLRYDEIVVPTRGKAEEIIAELRLIIREDGQATVGQLFEMVQQMPTYTDQLHGWRSLDSADWRKVRDGYLLLFPAPKSLS